MALMSVVCRDVQSVNVLREPTENASGQPDSVRKRKSDEGLGPGVQSDGTVSDVPDVSCACRFCPVKGHLAT